MYYLKLLLCAIILMGNCAWGYGQDARTVDSLKNILKDQVHDTLKVQAYARLAKEYDDADSALVMYYTQKAIDLSKKHDYHRGMGNALLQRGFMLYLRGHYNESVGVFEQLKEIGQKYSSLKGEALGYWGMAINYADEGKYALANVNYEKALLIYQKLNDQNGMAKVYNGWALIYQRQGDIPKALDFYLKALSNVTILGNKNAQAALQGNIGRLYQGQSNYPRALYHLFAGLRLEEARSNKIGIALAYRCIGDVYADQTFYTKALQYELKALKIYRELDNQRALADGFVSIGGLYYLLKDYNQALQYYDKALAIKSTLGEKPNIIPIYINQALVYQATQQPKKSIECSQKALQISEELGNKPRVASCLIALGKGYYMLKNYALASKQLKKGLALARVIKKRSLVRDGTKTLAKVYQATGDYKEALETFQLFKEISDSLFNKEKIEKITRLEANYDYNKKSDSLQFIQDKEKALLNGELYQAQLSQKLFRNTTIFVVIVLVLMLGVTFFIFISRQKQRRLNIKLLEQKEDLRVMNEELKTNQQTLMVLKAKEQQLLQKAMQEKERRFLVLVQLFDEKYRHLVKLEHEMAGLAQRQKQFELTQLHTDFKGFIQSIASLDILTESLESKYPQLLTTITNKFPQLSKNDVKHSLLIQLNCSVKEAAQLLEVSTHAVEMARKRLKKKLNLQGDESVKEKLNAAIQSSTYK